jgi:hypothetical protein
LIPCTGQKFSECRASHVVTAAQKFDRNLTEICPSGMLLDAPDRRKASRDLFNVQGPRAQSKMLLGLEESYVGLVMRVLE